MSEVVRLTRSYLVKGAEESLTERLDLISAQLDSGGHWYTYRRSDFGVVACVRGVPVFERPDGRLVASSLIVVRLKSSDRSILGFFDVNYHVKPFSQTDPLSLSLLPRESLLYFDALVSANYLYVYDFVEYAEPRFFSVSNPGNYGVGIS